MHTAAREDKRNGQHQSKVLLQGDLESFAGRNSFSSESESANAQTRFLAFLTFLIIEIAMCCDKMLVPHCLETTLECQESGQDT